MKFIIFALLTVSVLTQGFCPKYCLACTKGSMLNQKRKTYSCGACLEHETEGTKTCSTTAPKTSNCAVFQNGNKCIACQKGYLLYKPTSLESGLEQQQRAVCKKMPTTLSSAGCIYGIYRKKKSVETDNHGLEQASYKYYCLACQGFMWPSTDFASCTKKPTGLEQQRNNCEWGTARRRGGKYQKSCLKCRTGYVYDRMSQKCVKSTLVGCLWNDKGDATKCGMCNFLNHYYNKTPSTCRM